MDWMGILAFANFAAGFVTCIMAVLALFGIWPLPLRRIGMALVFIGLIQIVEGLPHLLMYGAASAAFKTALVLVPIGAYLRWGPPVSSGDGKTETVANPYGPDPTNVRSSNTIDTKTQPVVARGETPTRKLPWRSLVVVMTMVLVLIAIALWLTKPTEQYTRTMSTTTVSPGAYAMRVNAKEFDLELTIKVVGEVHNNGPEHLRAVVDALSVGGKQLELLDDTMEGACGRVLHDADAEGNGACFNDGPTNAWILTKTYGRVKVECGSALPGCQLFLTSSQRAAFKALNDAKTR